MVDFPSKSPVTNDRFSIKKSTVTSGRFSSTRLEPKNAHYIKDQVTAKNVVVQYMSIEHQKANILTKVLPICKFEPLPSSFNVCEVIESHTQDNNSG